jgi:hypothetical protein
VYTADRTCFHLSSAVTMSHQTLVGIKVSDVPNNGDAAALG